MFYLPQVKMKTQIFGDPMFVVNRNDLASTKVKSETEVQIERQYSPIERELTKLQKELDNELISMRRRIKEKIMDNDTEFETQMYRNISSHVTTKLSILKEKKAIVDKKLDFKLKIDKLDNSEVLSNVEGKGDNSGLVGTTYGSPKTSFTDLTNIQNNTPDPTILKKETVESIGIIEQKEEPIYEDIVDTNYDFKPDPLNGINYELAANNIMNKDKSIDVYCHLDEGSGKFWLSYTDPETGEEIDGISKKRILTMGKLNVNKANMTVIDAAGSSYKLLIDDELNMPDYYKEQWDEIS